MNIRAKKLFIGPPFGRPRHAILAALFAICATGICHAQQPVFTPLKSSGIYDIGEKAGWTVTLPQGVTGGNYTYAVKKNNADVVTNGTLDLSSGKGEIDVTLNEAAMIYVQVTPVPSATPPTVGTPDANNAPPANSRGRGGRGNGAIALGAAVAPAKLQPSVPRPADFDAFWEGKLKALAAIPINPVLTPLQTKVEGVDLFTVKLDSVDSRVQGYLAKPSREGKFPALVIFQWAGVYKLQTSTVTDRAAEGWLTFDVDSHDIPPDQSKGVSQNYQAIGNTDRETSYFLDMYLRDSRAIDYIASRPDWDGKTIVVMGTSMGGQQSLVTAGLNPKITAVIVNEPSGADSNGDLHDRKAGYPNWPSNDPKIMATALYFDTVNFASRIKAPTAAAMGFIDTTAPPVGILTALDQIPGPKEAIPMIESDHNNITPQKQGAYDSRSKEILNTILNGGQFKPNEASLHP